VIKKRVINVENRQRLNTRIVGFTEEENQHRETMYTKAYKFQAILKLNPPKN
jgi:hypothetical protein